MFICNVKQYVHSHLNILYSTEELEYKNSYLLQSLPYFFFHLLAQKPNFEK